MKRQIPLLHFLHQVHRWLQDLGSPFQMRSSPDKTASLLHASPSAIHSYCCWLPPSVAGLDTPAAQ